MRRSWMPRLERCGQQRQRCPWSRETPHAHGTQQGWVANNPCTARYTGSTAPPSSLAHACGHRLNSPPQLSTTAFGRVLLFASPAAAHHLPYSAPRPAAPPSLARRAGRPPSPRHAARQRPVRQAATRPGRASLHQPRVDPIQRELQLPLQRPLQRPTAAQPPRADRVHHRHLDRRAKRAALTHLGGAQRDGGERRAGAWRR